MLTTSPERHVFFEVAEIAAPNPEPFMVVRIDTRERVGDGVAGVVESLHMTRDEARLRADHLSALHNREVQ